MLAWRALRPDLFRTAESVAALLQSDNLASVQDWRDAVPYSFFTAADDDQLFRTELLPRRDNAHWSAELPATLARRLLASECPSLETISARGVSLFCSPEGFQVFSASDGYYVRSSTSRPLSTAVMNVAHIDVDGPVVLVQDIFHGSNFAHFLFDWIIRVMAFAASRPIDPRDCVFVMGGFPKPFHQIVLNAVMADLGLTEANFFFPEDQVVIRSSAETIWFSDTVSVQGHPAQMFRPETTDWIRRLARRVVPTPPVATRRLYISRADAGRRMVANEDRIVRLLERHGFEAVLLTPLAVEQQITLVASATHVVGAHGMGLTLMAFNPGTPVLIELFNPQQGTDAYAFMAKGLGFDYTAIMGRPDGGREDFFVEPDFLTPRLPDPTSTPRDEEPTSPRWFAGVQTVVAAPDETVPSQYGGLVLRHVRDGTSSDSNVGWWEFYDLRRGQPYTGRCEIFIPIESDVADIVLHFYGATAVVTSPDLAQRGRWQSLAVTTECNPDTGSALLVLRMNGAAGGSVLTSNWSVTGPRLTVDNDDVVTLALAPELA